MAERVVKVNPPGRSKINWTGLVIACVGLASVLDYIPPEAEEYIVEIVLTAGGGLVMVWRTWFTEKPL